VSGSIAIVGMSCLYPEARTPFELWENVLAQRRAFRRLPSERLRAEDYFDADPQAPDKTYAAQAAVIEGYEFDRVAFRVVGSTYRSADLAHWLALDISSRALADAGFEDGANLPRESTGVVLGNTLTGEFSRANLMRLRWPYVCRVLDSALGGQGWSAEKRGDFLEQLEAEYKSPFPPVGEETLAGGLSNTIAGRICNQFDLKGGGYTVDGACASSLLAVANACSLLTAGDLDMALAGGVDLSLDPFEIVGFAKTGALAPELMRIYDARSAGFWPGEGCGFVVLMRHDDAIAEGRRIYAVIRGWGISSDGSGGITRPEVEGQLQALRRAYARAEYGIDSVAYFEGHGTGTNVGDATELKVISRARREARADAPPAAIGSIKGNIGHTKAAAGIAGLLKATMAVHTQLLPPTTGCDRPHPELKGPSPALRVLREPEPWPADRAVRASVSAMGFGGMNTHLTLEGVTAERRKKLNSRERRLAASAQDAELFLFAAPDLDTLKQQVDKVAAFAARLSFSEMADVAHELEGQINQQQFRAAVVASVPAELAVRLATLRSYLDRGEDILDIDESVFFSSAKESPKIGFLFPGQASPANLDGGIYRRRFGFVADVYRDAHLPSDSDGIATDVAQPGIVTASVAGLKALQRLGINGDVAVGHSLGEITALHWSGAFDHPALLRIARVRGEAMATLGSPTGSMAAIAASASEVRALMNGDDVSIVGFNSPRQTVISGESAVVSEVASRAQSRGLRAVALAVSHAFHTPLVAAAAPLLEKQIAKETLCQLRQTIVSTVTGTRLARETNLGDLLSKQVTSPVLFLDAVSTAAKDVDLFIEVGPGRVLTGLVSDIVTTPVIALDAAGASLRGVLQAAGAAFALGAPLNHKALFEDRLTRPFNLEWQPKFFVNPCELAPTAERVETRKSPGEAKPKDQKLDLPVSKSTETPLDLIRQLVAQRAELPVSAVSDESRLLNDLHLNSITVGQLVAEAAKRLQIPPLIDVTKFANASVIGVAQALEQLAENGAAKDSVPENRAPAGIDSWVRSFVTEWFPFSLETRPQQNVGTGPNWEVIAEREHPLRTELEKFFSKTNGDGVVVCLPAQPTTSCVSLLLKGARAVLEKKTNARFILVHHGCTAGGFARTFHLEHPEIATCIVDVPFSDPRAAHWVQQEALSANGYSECRYDLSGVRFEPRLVPLPLDQSVSSLPLTKNDVLLVTGGGKGIGAECALALARNSGTRLLLLGRSQPETDPELSANLARFTVAKIEFKYISVDVTNQSALKAVIDDAQRNFGKITAFLHAAGANIPQLINSLNETAFEKTLSPKIEGARNVLAAIDPGQLRLFLTFGSIIARTGLHGEADYAVANEWLTNLTEQFQVENPHCRCHSLEWSVWSGVGMGQRLGRIESLMQQGITPIPPETGLQILEQILRAAPSQVPIVITGRLGDLPTIQFDKPELPFLRFLEKTRVFYPGVELVMDAVLSSESDPYAQDHVYHGEPLFPAVMGMEAMAQVAMALANSTEPPSFEAVKLTRPVIIPANGKTTIRLAALVRESGEIEVALRTEQTGFQINHFEAICRFKSAADHFNTSEKKSNFDLAAHRTPLPLDPARDVYDDLLFHAGRFRRIKNYRLLRAKECLVQLEPDADTQWFSRYLPQKRVLGDTGVRDAAIHAIQACIPHARLLPVGVERITIGKIPCLLERMRADADRPELLLHAREKKREGDTFYYDLELLGADGVILEQWENLCLRKVETLARKNPWPHALLAPYLQRRFEEFVPNQPLEIRLGPYGSETAIQQLLGPSAKLSYRSDGKPEVTGNLNVSISHAENLTLAVAGSTALGCDIQSVSARAKDDWQMLLGPQRFALAETLSSETNQTLDIAATRVWTAIECLKKAGLSADSPLLFDAATEDGWILLRSGKAMVASYLADVRAFSSRVIISILTAEGRIA
jgi:enediyne polyketide synthase